MGSRQHKEEYTPPDYGGDDYGWLSLFGTSSLVEPHHLILGKGTPAGFHYAILEIVTGGEPYKDGSKGDPSQQYRPEPCWVSTPINGGVLALNFRRTVELSSAGGWTRGELINLAQQQGRITPPQAHELRREGNPGDLEARLARKA